MGCNRKGFEFEIEDVGVMVGGVWVVPRALCEEARVAHALLC